MIRLRPNMQSRIAKKRAALAIGSGARGHQTPPRRCRRCPSPPAGRRSSPGARGLGKRKLRWTARQKLSHGDYPQLKLADLEGQLDSFGRCEGLVVCLFFQRTRQR